jgi:hypothetical protein
MQGLLLHVHGQHHEHDDVRIIGDRTALVLLRDALDQVLNHSTVLNHSIKKVSFDAYCIDGEGYTVHVTNASLEAWAQGPEVVGGLPYKCLAEEGE